jgi:hypothetical protein
MNAAIDLTNLTNWLNSTYELARSGRTECVEEFNKMRTMVDDLFGLDVIFITTNRGGYWIVKKGDE